jgi:hypothetical protein
MQISYLKIEESKNKKVENKKLKQKELENLEELKFPIYIRDFYLRYGPYPNLDSDDVIPQMLRKFRIVHSVVAEEFLNDSFRPKYIYVALRLPEKRLFLSQDQFDLCNMDGEIISATFLGPKNCSQFLTEISISNSLQLVSSSLPVPKKLKEKKNCRIYLRNVMRTIVQIFFNLKKKLLKCFGHKN